MNGEERAGVFVPADALVALAADAARNGDLDTLERTLAAGMVVNATTPRGDSLLMPASHLLNVWRRGVALGAPVSGIRSSYS